MSAHILRGNFKHSFMMWFSRLYLYLYFEPTHLLWLNILLIHICQICAHVVLIEITCSKLIDIHCLGHLHRKLKVLLANCL